MSVTQYYGMLSQALCELELEFANRDGWKMITEESGVYNVREIAEGKVRPTVECWEQLHLAFPDKIPPP